MIKAACVCAAIAIAAGWELARMLRDLERAFSWRESW